MDTKNKLKTTAFIVFVVGAFAMALGIIGCAVIDYFDEQIYTLNVSLDPSQDGYE